MAVEVEERILYLMSGVLVALWVIAALISHRRKFFAPPPGMFTKGGGYIEVKSFPCVLSRSKKS